MFQEQAGSRILTHYAPAPLPRSVCVYTAADSRPRSYTTIHLMAEFLVNGGMCPSVQGAAGDRPIVEG